ncbi:MAG: nucleotide pyrophosphohydrolase [Nanoarchaeota archaeon]|nr:nucleotide pyrophosphohydrolase [Nanoarchaeota archaeon]
MEIKEMQEKVHKWAEKHGGYWEPMNLLGRLTEETGEVARIMNSKFGQKKIRNPKNESELAEELADILIVITALANTQKINLEKALTKKLKKDLKANKGLYIK